MPLYAYGTENVNNTPPKAVVNMPSGSTTPLEAEEMDSTASSCDSSVPSATRPVVAARTLSYYPTSLDQPTRAICLDNFVSAVSPAAVHARVNTETAAAHGPRNKNILITLSLSPAPLRRGDSTAAADSTTTRTLTVHPRATPGRREWARECAIAMLGGRIAPDDLDEEEQRQISGWWRFVTKLFAGLLRR
ncbi:hypothetical protein LTR78_007390 [Recurvomyces mirabilis]|uniref:Uncharacterized protein n=1 Tax=Recurvomyces mirabilis TaxID=574656 RepID=A0AAE0WJD9_9PEZI|nr:hypothetical protein LTR78_007390 [Recurvomyces mirabilis]KAK5155022.1 hypothetical protein LTS14_005977 [Recurvomyces mirabilis]